MAKIYDPIGWLEKNAKPNWIIEVCSQPFGTEHEEEGHNPEISNVTLKGSEAGKIGRVIDDYYEYLRDTFPDVESPRTYSMLTVKKPRRNGGYIWSSLGEEPRESWWWAHRPHQFNIPLGPKDIYCVWEDVHKDRSPAKKRKVAPKKSNPILKMAAWLEELPPKGRTVMMNFDGGETLRFTSKTWQEMLDVIKSNARAKKMDVIIEGKKERKTHVAYAVLSKGVWRSMPSKDVKILYTIRGHTKRRPDGTADLCDVKFVPPATSLKFADFRKAYPDSPVRKELKLFGLKD